MMLLKHIARRLPATPRRHFAAKPEQIFLHLSPSGDAWVGSNLYAAKHNPSDYVRSLPLPPNRVLAEDVPPEALHAMYDAKAVDAALPPSPRPRCRSLGMGGECRSRPPRAPSPAQ